MRHEGSSQHSARSMLSAVAMQQGGERDKCSVAVYLVEKRETGDKRRCLVRRRRKDRSVIGRVLIGVCYFVNLLNRKKTASSPTAKP